MQALPPLIPSRLGKADGLSYNGVYVGYKGMHLPHRGLMFPERQSVHKYEYLLDKKIIDWTRLEENRIRNQGLQYRFSRHFNVKRSMPDSEPAYRTYDMLGPCSTMVQERHITERSKNASSISSFPVLKLVHFSGIFPCL